MNISGFIQGVGLDYGFFTYIGASVIALFAGFLTGIFGVGGGFLMVPALIILLGVPGNVAVGTDLAVILVNSGFGMFRRRGTKTVDMKLGFCLASGGFAGVSMGVLILEWVKQLPALVIFDKEHIAAQYILLCLFLVLLVWVAGFMLFDLRRTGAGHIEKRVGLFAKIRFGPCVRFASLEEPAMSLVPVVAMGCVIGILQGLMGIGGGVVMLPALVYLVGQRTTKAVGTSLLFVWACSLVGAVQHILHGNVDAKLFAAMVAGGIIGTNFGTLVGLKLTGPRIRSYFVYIVILAAAVVAFELIRVTFG